VRFGALGAVCHASPEAAEATASLEVDKVQTGHAWGVVVDIAASWDDGVQTGHAWSVDVDIAASCDDGG
jgi:hypothetical protein